MAIVPAATDSNRKQELEKLAETHKRLKNGDPLDPEKTFKSGPDQERRAAVEEEAKANQPESKKK